MVVEFLGGTGTGKTTLLRAVQHHLSLSVPATNSADAVTGLVGLASVRNATLQNLLQEVIVLPSCVLALHRYRSFVRCTMRLVLRHGASGVMLFNNLRSVERKLGVHALTERLARHRIVLVDEGPLLAAHMFVQGCGGVTERDLAAFVDAVPLPDLIVYVDAPVPTVVQRTLRRRDPPREVRLLAPEALTRYATATAALFERLIARLSGVRPILVVENPDSCEPPQAVVARVANFILGYQQKAA